MTHSMYVYWFAFALAITRREETGEKGGLWGGELGGWGQKWEADRLSMLCPFVPSNVLFSHSARRTGSLNQTNNRN